MLATAIIVFREVLEAALIVGIVLAATQGVPRRGVWVARGIGAGDAANAKPGQTLLAAIAETPRGTLFVQLFGPSARVTAERETLIRFVKGLK